MTAGQSTQRQSKASLPGTLMAALLATTLLGGAAIGAAVTLRLGSTDAGIDAIGAPAAPAPIFDAEDHRGDVRLPVVVGPASGPDRTWELRPGGP
jgi:hypothetical protein